LTLRICVSILPKTAAEALRLVGKVEETGADLVEVRLDRFDDLSGLMDLAVYGKTLKIATDRSSRSSGERQRRLLSAAKSGFHYVDLDLNSQNLEGLAKEVKALGTKCIVSSHDFNGSPSLSELKSVLKREIFSGADVCKIIPTATQVADNLTLLQFTQSASARAKIVCFAMGELGRVSRLLSPVFGGFFTFASLRRGGETAAGQMTIQEMRSAYEILGLK
jgi:3-dehydroquinate dehydratase type I